MVYYVGLNSALQRRRFWQTIVKISYIFNIYRIQIDIHIN